MSKSKPPPLPDWVPGFIPRPPWWGGNLQTIASKLQPTDSLGNRFSAEEYVLPLNDDTGDCLAATLYSSDSRLGSEPRHENMPPQPVIVLLHGLGGTSQSSYIQSTADYLLKQGHRVMLVDFRGAGDSASHCDRLHHPGRSQDVASLLEAIDDETGRQLREAKVILVGYSLGGSVLLTFLAKSGVEAATVQVDEAATEKTDEPIDAPVGILGAVTVSAPLDLAATSKCLGRVTRWPFQQYLLTRMRDQALAEGADLTEAEKQAVSTARSVWEFDETFTAPRCGFDRVTDYYEAYSAGARLASIKVPTLLIYALDDPFVPAGQYHERNWEKLTHLQPLIVPSGGHAGFQTSDFDSSWHDHCIDRFVRRLIGEV